MLLRVSASCGNHPIVEKIEMDVQYSGKELPGLNALILPESDSLATISAFDYPEVTCISASIADHPE